jgi:TolA-binding protein
MAHFRKVRITSLFLVIVIQSFNFAYGQDIQKPNTTAYSNGINLFENGQYVKSADELAVFINDYPNHELVASAAFYRARARGEVDPAQAGAYYRQFMQSYPNTVFAQKLVLDIANNKKENGNYEEAIDYYQQALLQSINDKQASRVYYWLAEVEAERGNNNEARAYFLKLADDYPDSDWAPKALYARGRLFLTENEFEASSEAFELLENRYPNDDITRRIGTALGESYYQQNQYQKAVDALKNGLPYLEGDQKAKAIYLIAESYNALNRFDQASSNYLQYINLTKGTDKERTAHYGLGWVYHKQEIYHWAADEFEKAAAGQDTLARKAQYYKAVNEKLGGRYEQSIQSFREFGDRYKKGLWFEEGYYEWAITAYEMGNYGEAIEALLTLVRSDKNLKWQGKIYTLLGQSYFANKEYTRALQAFNAAEDLTDIDPAVKREARFQKAWVQYRNQAYEPAQKIFEDLYRESPDTDIGQQALFWNADSYYNLEEYGPASREFNRFIGNNPDSKLAGAARYSLGWSYFKMGQYENAIQPFRNFLNNYNPPDIALFPYDTDTRLRLGDSYYALSNYNQAIQIYQQSVNDEPGGDYALFQIANSYYRSERTYEAVTTFRRFLRTFPNSRLREQAQYNIAYIYLNTENYEQAIQEFQTAINNYSGTQWAARSQYNIGDAYYNAGDYDQAITAYKKVLEQYPNSDYVVEAANGIDYARQSAASGNPAVKDTTTLSAVDEYIADNPQSGATNDRLRYRQAESLVQTGDYIKAIEKLEQYIRISNNQELLPDAYVNLATSYEQANRPAKAVETYQTIIDEYPNSNEATSALALLGNLMFARNNYQVSFDYYNQLLDKGGSNRLQAYVGMGNARLGMGNAEAAKEQYQSALQINGSYEAAKVGLAKVAIRQVRYPEAEQQLGVVAESNTTEVGAEAQYLLGVAKQQQGKYNEALDEYANVRVLYKRYDNWVAKSMLKSGECYIQLGNNSEARKILETLMQEYPRTAEARQAQRMLGSN